MPRKNNKLDEDSGAASDSHVGKRRGPKKKPPRPQQLDDFRAAMDLRRQYREDLLKEIRVSYEPLPTDERERARINRAEFLQVEKSVYYYWWLFVQGGLKFRSPERDPALVADVACTVAAFRNLDVPFETWWEQIGRGLFTENGDLPLIEVQEIDEAFDVFDPTQFPAFITVKIPLTIPLTGIQHQLNKILSVCHPGNALKVHESSTATIKIHAKKEAQIAKLSKYHAVWTAVEQDKVDHPDPAQRRDYWEIGRDLGLSKGVVLEGRRNSQAAVNRTNLQTEIRTIYEKADRLVRNALRGEFPKA